MPASALSRSTWHRLFVCLLLLATLLAAGAGVLPALAQRPTPPEADGAVYDIATAPRSAKEFNRTHDGSAQAVPAVHPRGKPVGLAARVQL